MPAAGGGRGGGWRGESGGKKVEGGMRVGKGEGGWKGESGGKKVGINSGIFREYLQSVL